MSRISFYIAYKYLRSKKSSRFTSIISKSSIIGISLGIAAIIVVMSIMNGFHNEMRNKILSMVSHVIITDKNYTLSEWDKVKFNIDKNEHSRGLCSARNGGSVQFGNLLVAPLPEHQSRDDSQTE